MAKYIDRSQYRNPAPPSADYDFEISQVQEKPFFYIFDDKPSQFLNYLYDVFPEAFGSDPESSVSSLTPATSDDEIIEVIEPPKKPIEIIETIISSDEEHPKEKTPERKLSPKKKKSPPKKKRSSKTVVQYSDSDKSDSEPEHRRSKSYKTEKQAKFESDLKRYENEEPEDGKPIPGVSYGFGTYTCIPCCITLTSEVTLRTHLNGKRHFKQLKAMNVSDVAKQSILVKQEEPREAIMKRPIRSTIVESLYPKPEPGIKRMKVNASSYIQKLVNEYKAGPMAGLDKVVEIRHLQNIETTYYCRLCDAPCASSSIMNHLIGFKHRLRCLEVTYPREYEKYRFQSKKAIERRVDICLIDDEIRYGRGHIEVEEDVLAEPSSREPQPGPSRSAPDRSLEREMIVSPQDDDLYSHEDLDMSQNDFRCIVCDSHMNNKSMWEAHIRGKRHLKNKNKYPGESASKVRSVLCPNADAHLLNILECVGDPIIGLEFIRETQGDSGDTYNCFLCGACMTDFDIVDHLVSTKHRIKHLETVNKRGKFNGIEEIKKMHELSNFNKDSLVQHEAVEHLRKYGPGRVEVYKSKATYPLSSGSRF